MPYLQRSRSYQSRRILDSSEVSEEMEVEADGREGPSVRVEERKAGAVSGGADANQTANTSANTE